MQEKIEHLEKTIIENSGRVIDQLKQSMFLIIDDGFDQNIWDDSDQNELNQQVKVHSRFIYEC